MSHYPAGSWPSPTNGFRTFAVDYTCTGSEGTDFTVPIGQVMADTTYAVTPSLAGSTGGDGSPAGFELLAIPKGNREIGQFRVIVSAQPSAGDILEFLISGTVS